MRTMLKNLMESGMVDTTDRKEGKLHIRFLKNINA